MITVTKSYRDLPAAHRQPNHDGHCRLIHGHNWGFDITFACRELDANGFVIDVGKLKAVKQWLERHFDHTLLLNEDDPHLQFLENTLQQHSLFLTDIVIVPNCGMEGLARFVATSLNGQGRVLFGEEAHSRCVRIVSVTCHEDGKNSATYVCDDKLP